MLSFSRDLKKSRDFTEKTFPLYVKTKPRLVAADTVVGDIFSIIT